MFNLQIEQLCTQVDGLLIFVVTLFAVRCLLDLYPAANCVPGRQMLFITSRDYHSAPKFCQVHFHCFKNNLKGLWNGSSILLGYDTVLG
jgi:hypothetical protein